MRAHSQFHETDREDLPKYWQSWAAIDGSMPYQALGDNLIVISDVGIFGPISKADELASLMTKVADYNPEVFVLTSLDGKYGVNRILYICGDDGRV